MSCLPVGKFHVFPANSCGSGIRVLHHLRWQKHLSSKSCLEAAPTFILVLSLYRLWCPGRRRQPSSMHQVHFRLVFLCDGVPEISFAVHTRNEVLVHGARSPGF